MKLLGNSIRSNSREIVVSRDHTNAIAASRSKELHDRIENVGSCIDLRDVVFSYGSDGLGDAIGQSALVMTKRGQRGVHAIK